MAEDFNEGKGPSLTSRLGGVGSWVKNVTVAATGAGVLLLGQALWTYDFFVPEDQATFESGQPRTIYVGGSATDMCVVQDDQLVSVRPGIAGGYEPTGKACYIPGATGQKPE